MEALESGGIGVHAVATEGPGTAGGIARREIEAGADLILVAGGDGTVNESLPGIAGTPGAARGASSRNRECLVHGTGFGNSMHRAAQQLARLVERRIALGGSMQAARRGRATFC